MIKVDEVKTLKKVLDCLERETFTLVKYPPLMEDFILPPQPPPENPWKNVIQKPMSKEKEGNGA